MFSLLSFLNRTAIQPTASPAESFQSAWQNVAAVIIAAIGLLAQVIFPNSGETSSASSEAPGEHRIVYSEKAKQQNEASPENRRELAAGAAGGEESFENLSSLNSGKTLILIINKYHNNHYLI